MSEQTATTLGKVRMTYLEFLDESPMTPFLWWLFGGVIFANLLDGMDFQMIAYGLPGIMKEFHLNPALAGGVASMSNFGFMCGTVIFALLSDRYGRKPLFSCVLFIFAFGSFLTAITPSYNALLVARFICGMGLGAMSPISAAIVAEFAPRKYRHFFLGMLVFIFSVGWIVAALLSIWCIPQWGWRSIFWFGIAPVFLIVIVGTFLPESIRWLLVKGKTEEAGRIAKKLALRRGLTDIELIAPVTPKNQFKLSFGQQLNLMGKFWVPGVLLIIYIFCFYIAVFGMNAWLPTIFVRQGFTLVRSFNYTLIIFSVAPFSQFIGIWLEERIKRKYALLLITVVGMALFICFGMSFQYHWPVKVLVGSQLLETLIINGAMGVVYTIIPEVFPTPVRALGFGLVQALGRSGAVVGPLALGIFMKFGTQISDIIYYFAAPITIAAILVAIFIKQDPRQRTLESVNREVLKDETTEVATAG